MTTLVHVTDAKNVALIRRNGIRPVRPRRQVFFMPVVDSHLVTHQWLRELRRRGMRTIVGVYFQLPKDEMVWAGAYNEEHKHVPLNDAVKLLMERADPLGFEMFIDRPIRVSELHAIRSLPQTIGWRYHPKAHGQQPCPCPYCQRGGIRAARVRAMDVAEPKKPSFNEIVAALNAPSADEDVEYLMWQLHNRRRRASPDFLAPYLQADDSNVVETLALTLPYFRHPDSKTMLLALLVHSDERVRTAAQKGLRTWPSAL